MLIFLSDMKLKNTAVAECKLVATSYYDQLIIYVMAYVFVSL